MKNKNEDNTPSHFEKRGKAYIGQSAAIEFNFGQLIIMAPDIETLRKAYLLLTDHEVDEEMVAESALISAFRVSPRGTIKP